MSRWIELSKDLKLPLDAATQKLAFLARSGAGKTYGAGKFVEGLNAAGVQVVVVDPVGVWWGLRVAADGHGPGIGNIYVFGGQRGDVPLEPAAGELVANLIVDHGISVVLDVSEMTGGEMRRFVAEFSTQMLRRKKTSRSPLMIVWEECQDFVPQKVMHDAARMVGAVEKLVKQGRNHGVGTTLISQRPQAVNKDVLNQTECLIVLQLTGPQERKTIAGWVVENAAEVADAVEQLPALERGQAFVWSPQWLRMFKKIRIGKKWTFDASSTPEFGGRSESTRELAPIDKETILAAMQETIERQQAEDPKALRDEITRLKSELSAAHRKPVEPQRVKVPVLADAHITRLEAALEKLAFVLTESKMLADAAAPRLAEPTPSRPPRVVAPHRREATPAVHAASNGHDACGFRRGAREMLVQLARMSKLTRQQLATLSDMSSSSGTFSTYLGEIKRAGYVVDEGGELAITEAGRSFIGPVDPSPPTTDALVAMWNRHFRAGGRKMLQALVERYPAPITRAELAAAVEMESTSGTFSTYLGELRRNGLAENNGRWDWVASPTLFIGGGR